MLLEAGKQLHQTIQALVVLYSATLMVKQNFRDEGSRAKFAKDVEIWVRTSQDVDQATVLVAIVCKKETYEALAQFKLFANELAISLSKDMETEKYEKEQPQIANRSVIAMKAIREELGIEDAENHIQLQ